ncbi:O-antigen ligase family protein [Nostoc sp. MG11]|uniref:O-antigen ligase family protein n=1 Tax=Nostoc sp. MG11 TaxID=2721166 RepID=UPI001D025E1E|nr:O-antigen ligase family protein [Nostoc sp. MG11]
MNTSLNISQKNIQSPNNLAVISTSSVKNTQWQFLALCLYLLSQSFTIPILAIGSWATWLTFPDLATSVLFLTFILSYRHKKLSAASSANKKIFVMLIFVLLCCITCYLIYFSNLIDPNANGVRLGIYQIYRLVEFLCVFGVTAQIPLTPKRIDVLKQITNFVLIFVCLSIILTFFAIVPLGALTAHLPQGKDIAGAWSEYARLGKIGGRGWGTISYNHGCVAAHVTMIAALRIYLGLGKQVIIDFLLLFLSLIACFITESRTGFLGILLFVIVYMLTKPRNTVIAIGLAALLFGIIALTSLGNLDSVNLVSVQGSVLDRQTTLLDAGNAENLSGRDNIWEEKVQFLNQEPWRWIVGTGFGSAWDNGVDGGSAHLLFLHIILENGILGLLIFAILFYKMLYLLYQNELYIKPIFWATVIFLITSFTQEIFYPIPAMGSFIGFYLCSVAIALRKDVKVIK